MAEDLRYTGKEQRKNTRWYGELPCESVFFYDVKDSECIKKSAATVKDFSATGLCINIHDFSGVDTGGFLSGVIKAGIRFLIPGRIEVKAVAKAAWIREDCEQRYVSGLTFTDISNTTSDILREFIIDFYLEKGKV